MWSLSRRPYIGVQGALLENPSLVSGVIQALAQSNRFNLQVSAHPNTLPSLLQQLAASSEKPLAQRIAKNPAANPETLKILAAAYQDEEPLLCSIVEHPNVDRDVILCLAASASQRVRILAARHKLFSEEMRSLFVKAGSSKNLICYGSPDLGWAEAELRRARALGPFPRALAILHPNATTPFLDEELSARDLHSLAPLWEQLGEEVIKARCRARPELCAVIQRG